MFNPVYDLCLVLILLENVLCALPTVRQTIYGPVEGIEQQSSLGQTYYAFKGVPYAEPPITGIDPHTSEKVDRRFKAPEPLKRKWTENLKVQQFGDVCTPLIPLFGIRSKSSEDCLFLNIYVPAGGAEKKTVLVWLHGGFFIGGEPTDLVYGPDFLISADNIFITVHYRLGVFGFLNLGFGEYTGNMGLKDQQLALEWIHENIENFSGNKNEVLLFGVSAGGSSVHFHMLNEKSRKYFRRAFLSSGTAFSYFALSKDNHLERMQRFSKIIDTNELIEYLKNADEKVLAECHPFMGFEKLLGSSWTPTIESPDTNGAFITEPPEEMYNSGSGVAIDVLFSFTSREYITFDPNPSSEPLLREDAKESQFSMPFRTFDEDFKSNTYGQAVKKLRDAYFPNTSNKVAIQHGNVNLISDMNFGYSVLKALIFQMNLNNNSTESGNKNTFLFRFGLDIGLNVFKLKYNLEYDGAGHVDDLCYTFHCHMLDEVKAYDKHLIGKDLSYQAIMRIVNIITNFARTGNPSIEGDTAFKPCQSSTGIFCQEISNDLTSTVMPDIMEQLHYQTWHEIEESYAKSNS